MIQTPYRPRSSTVALALVLGALLMGCDPLEADPESPPLGDMRARPSADGPPVASGLDRCLDDCGRVHTSCRKRLDDPLLEIDQIGNSTLACDSQYSECAKNCQVTTDSPSQPVAVARQP